MLLLIVVPVSLFGAVKVFAGFMLVSFVVEVSVALSEDRRMKRLAE